MSNQNAIRDANSVPVMLGVDDVTGETREVLTDSDGNLLVVVSGTGGGDVIGPGSSTDNAIARFDGTTGLIIQNSGVIIDDTDNVTGVATLSASSLAASTSITLEETGAGTDKITLQAPASIAAPYTLTLPIDDGAAGQFLGTDGSGVLSWSSPSGAGDVTGPGSATDNAVARFDGTTGKLIQNSGVTIDDSGNITANNLTGTSSGTNTGDQTITLTGDVTGSGTGTFAATISNSAVTYAKIQNVSATDRVLGRSSVGAGVVEEIVMTAAGRALMDDATASDQRTTLGLGTMATQNANNVNITGGSITGVTITGITDLTVPDGGTGASTFTDGGVLIGNGTGAIQATSAGTAGYVLTSNGAGNDPTFQSLANVIGANSGFNIVAVDNGSHSLDAQGNPSYDDETGTIVVGGHDAGGSKQTYWRYAVATDLGVSLYRLTSSSFTSSLNTVQIAYFDGHYWGNQGAGNTDITQDSNLVTFNSNACAGAMAWDNNNNYILVCNTTTNVRRFTYSGTALTFVDNITLSSPINTDCSFVFDNSTSEYYFMDKTNDLIHHFDSSGTQIDTTGYSVDDTTSTGLVAINSRIYIVMPDGTSSATSGISVVSQSFIPTTITF